jgi:hypothetical protein
MRQRCVAWMGARLVMTWSECVFEGREGIMLLVFFVFFRRKVGLSILWPLYILHACGL